MIKESSVEFRVISSEMGITKGKLVFIDDSILDFRELIAEHEHDYRFQWMKKDKSLLSRWDSAPHHHKLKSFPFHRHVDEKRVVEAGEIDVLWLLDEIKNEVLNTTLGKVLREEE